MATKDRFDAGTYPQIRDFSVQNLYCRLELEPLQIVRIERISPSDIPRLIPFPEPSHPLF